MTNTEKTERLYALLDEIEAYGRTLGKLNFDMQCCAPPEGMDRADYMAICLPMLMRADFAVLLPGWRKSGGAQIEKALADYLRIRTVEISPEQLREAMEDLRK